MNVTIQQITDTTKEQFENLFNYYLYELSAYSQEDIGTKGTFEMEDISPYYKDERLYPYFITCNEKIVGFILVTSPPYVANEVDYSVQELFVLPKYRGSNIAKDAVMQIFKLYPGRYEVGMFKSNLKAVKFWTKLISTLDVSVSVEDGFIEIQGNVVQTTGMKFTVSCESIDNIEKRSL
ncbi:GNAT family N-acetyltransferase [Paenibacillus polysaccharolyticus]|uniref:GNAT family N-acetyltransferase n=1 Tax=Paenibacillus polysaccharolyticus TaxID=582692 RepID=UPI00203B2FBA|nr:GNAT family N-acetyltransferase [Paenibacillus polysaccharolyticus]MCM3132721.1 GNAT family N-acetyltransferase [Paenibacillus polysaccharolyticus]